MNKVERVSRSRAPEPSRASRHAPVPAPRGLSIRPSGAPGPASRHRGGPSSRDRPPSPDERGGHDNAIMAQLKKLAIQPIPAWAGLVAEMRRASAGTKLLHKLADRIRTVQNRAPVTVLSSALALRNSDRNRRLVEIQSGDHAMLHMVSPPFLRIGTGPSGANLERRMPRERPPNQSAHSANLGSKGSIA